MYIGHFAHMLLVYLSCSAGCPKRGAVISTWICMCLLRNWTVEGMLAWDWWSSGIMRKAPLFVGPLVHRDLTLWGLACVGWGYCPSFFPPPSLLSRTVTHQRGGRKWLFIHEHAQELIEEESQSAGYNCLSWASAIPQQPAWMLPKWGTGTLKDRTECTEGMAALWLCCNLGRLGLKMRLPLSVG